MQVPISFVRQLSHEHQQVLSSALINDESVEDDENDSKFALDEDESNKSKSELIDDLGPLSGVKFEEFSSHVMKATPAQIFDNIFAQTDDNSFFQKWNTLQNSLNVNVTDFTKCDSDNFLENSGIDITEDTKDKKEKTEKKKGSKYSSSIFKKKKNKNDKKNKNHKNNNNNSNNDTDEKKSNEHENNKNEFNIYERNVSFEIETFSRGGKYFSKIIPVPKTVSIQEIDFVEFFGRKKFTIVSLSRTKDVPIGKHFYLLNKCDFEAVFNKKSNKYETIGKLSIGCYWKKKYKIRSFIEKGYATNNVQCTVYSICLQHPCTTNNKSKKQKRKKKKEKK